MLYIVIQNENYYPCAGTDDWVVLTSDYDEAFDAYRDGSTRGYFTCIVAIDPKKQDYTELRPDYEPEA